MQLLYYIGHNAYNCIPYITSIQKYLITSVENINMVYAMVSAAVDDATASTNCVCESGRSLARSVTFDTVCNRFHNLIKQVNLKEQQLDSTSKYHQ